MTQASDTEHSQRREPMLWDKSHQAGFTQAQQARDNRLRYFRHNKAQRGGNRLSQHS